VIFWQPIQADIFFLTIPVWMNRVFYNLLFSALPRFMSAFNLILKWMRPLTSRTKKFNFYTYFYKHLIKNVSSRDGYSVQCGVHYLQNNMFLLIKQSCNKFGDSEHNIQPFLI
jgi:hypothetical protein